MYVLFSGLYFVLFFLAGCIDWIDVPESRYYPYKPRFEIQPHALAPDNTLLDCSAVYARKYQDGDKVVPDFYTLLRFWPSGHVYLRYLTHIPDSADADDFHEAIMGFYNLSGTNIAVELYWAAQRIGYETLFGHIEEDKIVFNKSKERTHSGRQTPHQRPANAPDALFYKYPLNGLSRLPDWSPTGMLWQAESFSGGIKR